MHRTVEVRCAVHAWYVAAGDGGDGWQPVSGGEAAEVEQVAVEEARVPLRRRDHAEADHAGQHHEAAGQGEQQELQRTVPLIMNRRNHVN